MDDAKEEFYLFKMRLSRVSRPHERGREMQEEDIVLTVYPRPHNPYSPLKIVRNVVLSALFIALLLYGLFPGFRKTHFLMFQKIKYE